MEWIYELCEKNNNIIIYGAGTVSNILYLLLKKAGYDSKIRCFAVTKRENNPYDKYGVPVLEAAEAIQKYKGALVLLGIQNVLVEVVSNYLNSINCDNYKHIDCEELINSFYLELYKYPIQNNKIIFSNMKNMGYGGNPKYIAQKLLEYDNKHDLDLVWVISEDIFNIPEPIRTVRFGSYEYYFELATSHIWIDNTRKNFDARKRQGQYYIQTWHGAAPIKKVEKDVENKLPEIYVVNAKNDSKMADLFLSGSRFYSELYRSSFWYDGEIMEVGLPRQDVFWNIDTIRNKVREFYSISDEYSIVLYAPTFRNDFSNKYYDINFDMILTALNTRFKRKFLMLVSKHPDNRFINYGFKSDNYISVEMYEDFEELLAAADVLITDYSGCMYDFSYTERPIFLYQNDYISYLKERDFYISMDELPYIKTHTNEELVNSILNYDSDKYIEKLHNFMLSMGNFDDGNASDKVAKFIQKIVSMEKQND